MSDFVNKKTEFSQNENGIFKMDIYEPAKQENDHADFIENQLVILPKQTIDKFLKYKNASDLIGLYTFYYYTAKWQKTNQPKCTDNYCMNGLKFSKERFYKAKKTLKHLGLIQVVQRKNNYGHTVGWYIKLNYICSINRENKIIQSLDSQRVDFPEGGNPDTNALSSNIKNALSSNKKMLAGKQEEIGLTKNELLKKLSSSYPASVSMKGGNKRSTQRSVFNREKAYKIIKETGIDEAINIINMYIDDCNKNGTFIKNFQTFINNFPSRDDFEYTESEHEIIPEIETKNIYFEQFEKTQPDAQND